VKFCPPEALYNNSVDLLRRQFLILAAASLLRAQEKSKQDKIKRDMLVRSVRPEDLEMPLSGFSDYLTPVEHFFVRSHVYVPAVNISGWRLNVGGSVASPLAFTLDDLKKLPAFELVSVLECAGNGRAFYQPPVPGMQWGHGAVGNALWRGVRLADVLKRAGLKSSAREILFDGADVPLGTMPDFQRSLPLAKALDPDTLLAYEMNGQPLPAKHGFPLRVVAPGWAGDSWVKWITSVRVLDQEHDGFWMKTAYRHPALPVAPGVAVPADRMQSVTNLRVKSVIASPLDGAQLTPGTPITVSGVAWSSVTVTAVDISADGGRVWKPAKLGPARQFGWRQWEFPWTPADASYYTLLARARDAQGNSQPLDQEWNQSGYLWNATHRVHVNAGPAAPATPVVSRAAPQSPAAFNNCLVCHNDDVIRQQRLTRAQWTAEINKMTGWGARLDDPGRELLLDYLDSLR
jgi:DMSO/TMAO reductase YedYZ molybdopterin-dependent catalytic subunit